MKDATKRCVWDKYFLVTGGSPHHPAGWFGMTPFILWLLQQPDKLKFEKWVRLGVPIFYSSANK
jgi:hypothetical protein